MKVLLCALGFLAPATLAMAADFYVVQNSSTMACSVVQQKPADASMKMVGSTYASEADAQAAIKANSACKP